MNISRHEKRAIRFVQLIEKNSWRTKLYGISKFNEFPDEAFLEVAETVAEKVLPLPAITDQRYGVAFITVHPAPMFN